MQNSIYIAALQYSFQSRFEIFNVVHQYLFNLKNSSSYQAASPKYHYFTQVRRHIPGQGVHQLGWWRGQTPGRSPKWVGHIPPPVLSGQSARPWTAGEKTHE